jgi:hypothetical protein
MKKWLIGIGLVLLCVAAAAVCFHLIGKARLARKIAELKAQGLPTSFAELEAYSKLPAGTPNAADIYLKTFVAYRPLPDAKKRKMLPLMGDQLKPKDNEPYPPEQIAAAAEFIELNKEMFALLHEAGKVESCYHPIDFSQGPFPKNDHLQNIRRGCQSLGIAVIYYSQTNQSQKAYEVLNDQLRLGQSISRSPLLISHLVRIAILSMGVSGAQEIINRITLNESDLRSLQGYLQQIEQTTKIGPALLGEICFCLEYRKLNCNTLPEKAGNFFQRDIIALIEAYQQMIEADKLPIQEQLPKVRKIIEEANTGFLVFPPRIILPAIERVYETHLRVRANMDCAIMALAIERYRLKEGKLPETVDELVPTYLTQVYLDPFDGKPLRYKRTDPGYIIYSVGEDGVDNGGQEQDPNNQSKTFDWVFYVYR